MLDQIVGRAPERWREVLAVLVAPILWIPRAQWRLIDFFVDSSSARTAVAKYVLLVVPSLLVLVALWCTQLSLYTLLFRARRRRFVATLLVTWWDALCAVWMYWVGLVRMVTVLVGWGVTVVGLAVRLLFAGARQLIVLPAAALGRMTDASFRPGMPWIALAMLTLWCALEATVFTYTLRPALAQWHEDVAGVGPLPHLAVPLLWVFLFMLIMGSFVCIQALIESLTQRQFKRLVPIVVVELFVMYFEVAFLYRELAEASMPWIVQHADGRFSPGPWFTLSVARFGWTGIRGLAWFLFGQYGTPPLLTVISRRPMVPAGGRLEIARASLWGDGLLDVPRREWLHDKGDELVTYLGRPVLHLVAAAVNFATVLVTARPAFRLPLHGLEDPRRLRACVRAR